MHPDACSVSAYTAARVYCVVQGSRAFVCAAPRPTVYGQHEVQSLGMHMMQCLISFACQLSQPFSIGYDTSITYILLMVQY